MKTSKLKSSISTGALAISMLLGATSVTIVVMDLLWMAWLILFDPDQMLFALKVFLAAGIVMLASVLMFALRADLHKDDQPGDV